MKISTLIILIIILIIIIIIITSFFIVVNIIEVDDSIISDSEDLTLDHLDEAFEELDQVDFTLFSG